ncbi:hypothetical protein C8Q80DRAFT_1147080 [Daedaleopsis nitida]|nr:hypothetical protein C8Q80DRAFT_1147080 [Daedaleopsis nitida]
MQPISMAESPSTDHSLPGSEMMEPPLHSSLTRHTSPNLNLNFDVVRAILAYCRNADLLQVSLASRELRDQAMNELVSRPVYLKGEDKARSFSRFMLAGDGFRLPLLRTLILVDIPLHHMALVPNISPDELDELLKMVTTVHDIAYIWSLANPHDAILEMLEHATNLRDLEFIRCGRYISFNDKFAEAVSALRHLVTFRAIDCYDHISNMALCLTSSLETLEHQIHLDEFGLQVGCLSRPDFSADALDTLARHQPRLKTLLFTCKSVTPTQWITPFSQVRVLDITVLENTIDFPHFVHLFPKLKELTVCMHDSSKLSFATPRLSAVRDSAIAWQAAGCGWPCLDVLCGTVVDLYTLAVTSPVHQLSIRLRVEAPVSACYPHLGTPSMLADVISGSRPQCVEVEFDCGKLLHQDQALGREPSTFVYDEHHPAGAVSHLVMGCFFPAGLSSSGSTPSTSELLDMISPLLKHSRVEYLHLTLTHPSVCHDWRKIGETECLATGTDMDPALIHVMSTVDIGVLVAGIVASGTHLRTVVLTVLTCGQSVWEVESAESEGHRILKKLDPYTGRQVIAREER